MEPNLKPDQVKQLRGNFSRYIDRTQLNGTFLSINNNELNYCSFVQGYCEGTYGLQFRIVHNSFQEILEKRPEDVFQFTAEELRKKSKMEIDTNQS